MEFLRFRRWKKKKKKKETELIFNEGLWKCASVVYNMEALKHFETENCVWLFLSEVFGQNVSKYLKQFSIKNYI